MNFPTISVSSSLPEPTMTELAELAPPAVGPSLKSRVLMLADAAAPVLTFVVVLALWELAVLAFAIPQFLLPAPSRIFQAFGETDLMIWLGHIWATLRIALAGYLLSAAIAIPLGILLATSRFLSRTLYPLLIVIQSLPVVAIAPIIVVTLGANDLPRIAITFLITFFPIVVSSVTGVAATPPELIELSRSLRAGTWREITQIRLPYALPHIFSALKISTTLAVIGAVVAEFVAADKGLGYFIAISTSFFRIPSAFGGLIILALMSLLLFQLVSRLQLLLAPWSLPRDERSR